MLCLWRRLNARPTWSAAARARSAEAAACLLHELAEILESRGQGAEDARTAAALLFRHNLRRLHLEQRFDLPREFLAL